MKYKQPKNVPVDKDYTEYGELNKKDVRSFGRRMSSEKKSYGEMRGTGAATKGKKFYKG